MSSKNKPSRHSRRGQPRAGRRWLLGGAVLLVMLAALTFLMTSRPPDAAAYFRHVSPGQVADAVQTGESVLVYFHSPT